MEIEDYKNWLAGFTCAEGNISIDVSRKQELRLGYGIHPKILWSQRIIPFLSGFLEGDGYIGTEIRKEKGRYAMKTTIQLCNSDYDLMKKLEIILNGLGIKNGRRTSKKNQDRPMAYLNISGLYNVKKLLCLIEPYLLGSKLKQTHIMLNEIIPRIEKKKHLTKEGFIEIMTYVDATNSLKCGKRGNYNKMFFENLWSIK